MKPPSLRIAASFVSGAWSGTTMLHGTPIRRACHATPCAMLPALAVQTPAAGVWTASAGNMAQGVAWQARRMGVPCSIVVPDHAPETKLAAIRRLGGFIVKVPFEEWFQILTDRTHPAMEGLFLHPFNDAAVMAGNATIGLE